MTNILDQAIKQVVADIASKKAALETLHKLRAQLSEDSRPFLSIAKAIAKKARAKYAAPKKRTLSKQARAKIAEAQKKRWAAHNKAKKAEQK